MDRLVTEFLITWTIALNVLMCATISCIFTLQCSLSSSKLHFSSCFRVKFGRWSSRLSSSQTCRWCTQSKGIPCLEGNGSPTIDSCKHSRCIHALWSDKVSAQWHYAPTQWKHHLTSQMLTLRLWFFWQCPCFDTSLHMVVLVLKTCNWILDVTMSIRAKMKHADLVLWNRAEFSKRKRDMTVSVERGTITVNMLPKFPIIPLHLHAQDMCREDECVNRRCWPNRQMCPLEGFSDRWIRQLKTCRIQMDPSIEVVANLNEKRIITAKHTSSSVGALKPSVLILTGSLSLEPASENTFPCLPDEACFLHIHESRTHCV